MPDGAGPNETPPPLDIPPDCHNAYTVSRWDPNTEQVIPGNSVEAGRSPCPGPHAAPSAVLPAHVGSLSLQDAKDIAARVGHSAEQSKLAADSRDMKSAFAHLDTAVQAAKLDADQACTGSGSAAAVACTAAKAALKSIEAARASKAAAEGGRAEDANNALVAARQGRDAPPPAPTAPGFRSTPSGDTGSGFSIGDKPDVAYKEPGADPNDPGIKDGNDPNGLNAPPVSPTKIMAVRSWPFAFRSTSEQLKHQTHPGSSPLHVGSSRLLRQRRRLQMLPETKENALLLNPGLGAGNPSLDSTLPINRPWHDPRMEPYTQDMEAQGPHSISNWDRPVQSQIRLITEMYICVNEADEQLARALFMNIASDDVQIECEPMVSNRAFDVTAPH